MIKNIGEPPKGTDKATHYLLETCAMVENLTQNGLNVFIPPTQIEKVFIKPKKNGDKKDARSSSAAVEVGQVM
jgi:hypothetical protein